jgi:hypothetical protein
MEPAALGKKEGGENKGDSNGSKNCVRGRLGNHRLYWKGEQTDNALNESELLINMVFHKNHLLTGRSIV